MAAVDVALAIKAVELAGSAEGRASGMEVLETVAGVAPQLTIESVLHVLRLASSSSQKVCCNLSMCCAHAPPHRCQLTLPRVACSLGVWISACITKEVERMLVSACLNVMDRS
jgi:hypothetical protein